MTGPVLQVLMPVLVILAGLWVAGLILYMQTHKEGRHDDVQD